MTLLSYYENIIHVLKMKNNQDFTHQPHLYMDCHKFQTFKCIPGVTCSYELLLACVLSMLSVPCDFLHPCPLKIDTISVAVKSAKKVENVPQELAGFSSIA